MLTAAGLLLGWVVAPAPAAVPKPLPGGSNYAFYQLDGCARDSYGVINDFAEDRAAATVRRQLAEMYAQGQRRLRLNVFHQRRSAEWDAALPSAGGRLTERHRANLTALLAEVRRVGFAEVLVSFHPLDESHPGGWQSWREEQYQENLSFVTDVRSVLAASRLPYRLDLLNEGSPAADSPAVLVEYARRLWRDHLARWSTENAVGFSMTVWLAGRVKRLPEIYGDRPPQVFDVHLYGDNPHNGTEYRQFLDAHQEMGSRYRQPWIVGETYYDDPAAAAGIAKAAAESGRQVLYLTQWPLRRQVSCPDVDTAPPVSYRAYREQGF